MPDDAPIPMRVVAEGGPPELWAYAIVYGSAQDILVRSQPLFASRKDAIAAGELEIENVPRNLLRASQVDGTAD